MLAAAIACAAFHIDGENGAEVYCAGADKGQAKLVWNMCKMMHTNEPEMESRVRLYTGSIAKPDGSFIQPISRDADTKHGFNTHVAVVDELHVHKDGELLKVLQTSMGAREQPFTFMITTADYNRPESICNTTLDYAKNVRDRPEGFIPDPSFLPIIFEADLKDDIYHPHTWYKANPNLGVAFFDSFMENEAREARNQSTFENLFKRLYLNIVTEAAVRWLSHAFWQECGKKVYSLDELKGEVCYGGLDLSSISDLTAFALWFPKVQALFLWHWAPEDNAIDRQKKDRVPYLTWRDQGHLELTPGNTIDYKYLKKRIVEIAGDYDLREVGFDPHNARATALSLVDDYGIDMVEFRQGFLSMNEPCKEFERLVLSREMHHNNNPIVTWQSANVVIKTDPSKSYKPDKDKSTEKIDGIVAGIMAIGCAMTPDEAPGPSVYEERGIIELG